jgi:peptidoglycan hydrolase-like protein with peptidoglycan-binding domain
LRLFLVLASIIACACGGHAAAADPLPSRPDPQAAGLQFALAARGLYRGPIDGIEGPATRRAVRALQEAHGLRVSGLTDVRTRILLGPLGRPRYASRTLRRGLRGLDVAALQFELRYHGFATRLTGSFTEETREALIGFQRFAGLRADGVAGRVTYRALRSPPPQAPRLRAPLPVPARTVIVHGGVELFCPYATPVAAPIAGTVTFAGSRGVGYGYTVVTRDRHGVELLYAHLARADVHVGDRLIPGAMIGLAGWTGKSRPQTSLRLELSIRGAALNPRAVSRALR